MLNAYTMKYLAISVSLFLFQISVLMAQPSNDDCANAVTLNFFSGPMTINGTSLGATFDMLNGIIDDCKTSGPFSALEDPRGVWYQIPTGTNEIHFSIDGSNHILALVKASSCSNLDFVSCNNCSGHNHVHNSSFTIAAPAIQHYILIYPASRPLGSPPYGNPFVVEFDDSPLPVPTNTSCSTSTLLMAEDTFEVSYRGLTHGVIDQERYYSFEAEYPEMTLRHLDGNSAQLVQYDTACAFVGGPLVRLGPGSTSYTWTNLTIGLEYNFRLNPFRYCEDGPLTLVLEGPPIHDNDSCQNAIALDTPTLATQSISVQSSNTYNAPHPVSCEGAYGVWYTITAPPGGEDIIFTGSYEGISFYETCSGSQVLCVDNGPNEEFVTLPNPGQSYLMYYESLGDPFSVFFSYRLAPPAPANDNCINATSLGTLTNSFTNISHAFDGGETIDELPDGTTRGVWYEFTTGSEGNVQVVVDQCAHFAIFDDCNGTFMGQLGYIPPPFCPFPPCPEPDTVLINFEPNTTYQLLFYTDCAANGTVRSMRLRTGQPSSGNDRCTGAIVVDLTSVDTVTSTVDSSLIRTAAAFGDLYRTRGLWYKMIIPSDYEINMEYCGSIGPEAEIFYQSDCTPTTIQASSDEIGFCHAIIDDPGPEFLPSITDTMMVYINATYFTMFGGFELLHGDIKFFKTPSRYPYAKRVDINSPCTSGCDGSSWHNAYRDMNEMLDDYHDDGQIIWVAEGTYHPDDSSGSSTNNRYDEIKIENPLKIFGGYRPTGEYSFKYNPDSFQTIFSGEIQQDGIHTNNSYTILFIESTANETVLDGIIVEEGHANAPAAMLVQRTGAGMFNYADITINNCIFRNNEASTPAAGVGAAIISYTGHIKINNSLFYNNKSTAEGGAVSPQTGLATLTNCTFVNNHSDIAGGGVHTCFATTNINNCIFQGNTAPASGLEDLRDACGAILTNVRHSAFSNSFSTQANFFGDNIELTYQSYVDSANNNFALLWGSSAIDAGDNTLSTSSNDFLGNSRIKGLHIDMGAYEFDYEFPCGIYSTLDIDDNPIYAGIYKASGLISSTGEVNNNSGGSVTFISENEINLNPNFEVKLGELLEARIEDPCMD